MIKFSMVRDFDSDKEDLKLKLGEFYNFKTGFMANRWRQAGISENIEVCLSDGKKCSDYLMGDKEVEIVDFMERSDSDEPEKPVVIPLPKKYKKDAFRWIGLKSS